MRISNYVLFPTNNFRSKIFYYSDVGGYQRLGTTWRSNRDPDYEWALLASDVAFAGQLYGTGTPTLSGHPSVAGSLGEHHSVINTHSGWKLGPGNGFTAPVNYANADGAVRTYRINGNSQYNTGDWVLHDNGKFLLPTDLAQ